MRYIKSVCGDLDVCVTTEGQLALMVEDAEGYGHVIEVPDMDKLIEALRAADLIAMEVRKAAEAARCPYTQSHVRAFCGRPGCRES